MLINSDNHHLNFEFLNGFRGFCALWVVLAHSICWKQDKSVDSFQFIFGVMAQTVAVNGFFILSSFLLTYRLLVDITKHKSIFLCITIYFIRRLFRIYFVYVLFCTLLKFGPKFIGGYFNYNQNLYYYTSWTDLISLNYTGKNHLWTIPPEVIYYFVLPIVPILYKNITLKFKLLLIITLILISHFFSLTFLNEESNLIIKFLSKNRFIISLPVFIQGTTLALVFEFGKSGKLLRYISNVLPNCKINHISFSNVMPKINNKTLYNTVTLVLIVLAFYSSLYHRISLNKQHIPGYWWSLVLWTMLISEDNNKKNIIKYYFLEKNYLFKWFGKFSFGIYLFHPMCIFFEEYHKNVLKNYANRYFFIVSFTFIIGLIFFYIVENNFIYLANLLIKKLILSPSNINRRIDAKIKPNNKSLVI